MREAGSWVWAPAAVRPPEHWGLKWFKREGERKAHGRSERGEWKWTKQQTRQTGERKRQQLERITSDCTT